MQIFLEDTLLYLRALEPEDATDDYVSWLNSPIVCKYNSHHRFPNTKAKTLEYIQNTTNTSTQLLLAICDKKSHQHIGNISLQSINLIDSSAELAILIGATQEHSKGFGEQAARLMIKHAFESFNLHRIYCGTSIENIAMQKLALKLNFIQEGLMKDAIFKEGRYLDIVNYGLINPSHSS